VLTTKGLTLIELVIVMIITGVLVSIAVPSYYSSLYTTKVQGVENNMRAIGAGEQKYNEDNSAYCSSGSGASATCLASSGDAHCADNQAAIICNLSLNLATVADGFTYTCAATGTCTANNPTAAAGTVDTVVVDFNNNVTCSSAGVSVTCP